MQDEANQTPVQSPTQQVPQWTAEQYAEYQRQLAAAQTETTSATSQAYTNDPYAAAQQYTNEQWAQPLAAAPVNDVDQRIAQEYAQMNTVTDLPKPGRLAAFFAAISAHKVLAIALVLSIFTIGTLSTLFVKYGGTKSHSQTAVDTASEDEITSDTSDDSVEAESDVTPSDTESDTASQDAEATSDDVAFEGDMGTEDLGSSESFDDGSSGLGTQTDPDPCDPTDPTSSCYEGSTDPPAPPAPTPITTSFSVTTYLVKSTVTPSQLVADLRKLINEQKTDIIALQGTVSTQYASAINTNLIGCSTCTYLGYLPTANDSSDLPMLWSKSSFTLVSSGATKVSDRTTVNNNAFRALFITTAYLQNNATKKRLYVLNVHPPVTGETGGKPTGAAAYTTLFQKDMTAMKNKITSLSANGAPVLVAGAYYVDYRSDSSVRYSLYPFASYASVATRANWQRLGPISSGTNVSNTRLVDYIHSRDNAFLSMTAQARLGGYTSDHTPVKVTFSLKDR